MFEFQMLSFLEKLWLMEMVGFGKEGRDTMTKREMFFVILVLLIIVILLIR